MKVKIKTNIRNFFLINQIKLNYIFIYEINTVYLEIINYIKNIDLFISYVKLNGNKVYKFNGSNVKIIRILYYI